jgi:antitoxin HicB
MGTEEMTTFPLDFERTLLVTCPVLPEVVTFGEDRMDAIRRGAEAIEEAIAARVARWEDVPIPDAEDLAPAFEKSQATRISLLADEARSLLGLPRSWGHAS